MNQNLSDVLDMQFL